MAQDLSQLLGLGQVQQEVQKRYSDALAEKRRLIEQQGQYQTIAQQAGERFKGALSSDNPVILNPQDVFGAYKTFNAAIKPGLEAAGKYTTDQDLLSQIASIAQQRETNNLKNQKTPKDATIDELLTQKDALASRGYDTTAIDKELESRGYSKTGDDMSALDAELAKMSLSDLAKQKTTLSELGIDTTKIDKELERRGYSNGDGQTDFISISNKLDKSSKGKAAEYIAFMKDIQESKNLLSGNGFGSDLMTRQTGPLSQLLGQYGPGSDVRTKIDKLNANVKNKTYGAAVSEGELKDANKWLPSSARQETQNVKRLETIYDSKKNELTSLLRTQGLNELEIKTYLDQMGLGDAKEQTSSSSQDQFSQYRSQIKQGEKLYLAPNGDVEVYGINETVPKDRKEI